MKTLDLKFYLVFLGDKKGGDAKGDKDGDAKCVVACNLKEAISLIEADPELRGQNISRIEEKHAVHYLTDRPIDYERYE